MSQMQADRQWDQYGLILAHQFPDGIHEIEWYLHGEDFSYDVAGIVCVRLMLVSLCPEKLMRAIHLEITMEEVLGKNVLDVSFIPLTELNKELLRVHGEASRYQSFYYKGAMETVVTCLLNGADVTNALASTEKGPLHGLRGWLIMVTRHLDTLYAFPHLQDLSVYLKSFLAITQEFGAFVIEEKRRREE